MSRQDPGAATGTGVYPTYPDCECGCSYIGHAIGRHGGQQVRTTCSTVRGNVPCGCRLYRRTS